MTRRTIRPRSTFRGRSRAAASPADRPSRNLIAAVAAACFAVATLAALSPAGATTLHRLSVEELSLRSDLVAVGTVVDQSAAFEGGVIWTTSTLEVQECWTGPCEEATTLQIRTPGGVIGDVEQRAMGVFRPAVGERLVTFLRRGGAAFRPTSLGQGTMRVVDAGVPTAIEAIGDVEFSPRAGLIHESLHARQMPLQALRQRVLDATR